MADQVTVAGGRGAVTSRLLPPGAVAAGSVALLILLHLADPREGEFPSLCPFLMVTGRWCPACGGLRATRALMAGDLTAAVGYNALAVVAIPVLVYVWFAWTLAEAGLRGPPPVRLTPRTGWWLVAAGAAFWLLRNLPGFEMLTP